MRCPPAQAEPPAIDCVGRTNRPKLQRAPGVHSGYAKRASMAHRRASSVNTASRLLIVEDELLVALIIEEMARNIGFSISGVAHTTSMLRSELARHNFDAVLLDAGFDARVGFQFADTLVAAHVPFAFVTGYDYLLEPRHDWVPVLQKPFTPAQLGALLGKLVGVRRQEVADVA